MYLNHYRDKGYKSIPGRAGKLFISNLKRKLIKESAENSSVNIYNYEGEEIRYEP